MTFFITYHTTTFLIIVFMTCPTVYITFFTFYDILDCALILKFIRMA